jgi:HAMP domain-containing protein
MAHKAALEHDPTLAFARRRVHAILAALEAAAAGEYSKLPLSRAEDELDAIAHAVNVLVDELRAARLESTRTSNGA